MPYTIHLPSVVRTRPDAGHRQTVPGRNVSGTAVSLLILVLLNLCLLLSACTAAQKRGLSGGSYISSTRPPVSVTVPDLPLQGCLHTTVQLHGMGVMGGLPVDTWLTLYGTQDGPQFVAGHAELPQGWRWESNMQQPFAVDTGEISLNGRTFFAQTFLTHLYRNPCVDDERTRRAKEEGKDDRWLVRSFTTRFNNDTTKLILEYRERLPEGIQTLSPLPPGHGNLLTEFAERAARSCTLAVPDRKEPLTVSSIPGIRLRYLDDHFFGQASPVAIFPFR